VSTDCSGGARPRVIVIPRPLAGFFYERLTRQYAARPNVAVVVDRRVGERRRAAKGGRVPDRRAGERRANEVFWSLAEMPFAAAATGE
jgi:hypothetical protein